MFLENLSEKISKFFLKPTSLSKLHSTCPDKHVRAFKKFSKRECNIV